MGSGTYGCALATCTGAFGPFPPLPFVRRLCGSPLRGASHGPHELLFSVWLEWLLGLPVLARRTYDLGDSTVLCHILRGTHVDLEVSLLVRVEVWTRRRGSLGRLFSTPTVYLGSSPCLRQTSAVSTSISTLVAFSVVFFRAVWVYFPGTAGGANFKVRLIWRVCWTPKSRPRDEDRLSRSLNPLDFQWNAWFLRGPVYANVVFSVGRPDPRDFRAYDEGTPPLLSPNASDAWKC